MYRGLARLVGMEVLSLLAATLMPSSTRWRSHLELHDFAFIHYKSTDAAGEDGDFDAKVAAIEELDRRIPRLASIRCRRARGCGGPLNTINNGRSQLASSTGAD